MHQSAAAATSSSRIVNDLPGVGAPRIGQEPGSTPATRSAWRRSTVHRRRGVGAPSTARSRSAVRHRTLDHRRVEIGEQHVMAPSFASGWKCTRAAAPPPLPAPKPFDRPAAPRCRSVSARPRSPATITRQAAIMAKRSAGVGVKPNSRAKKPGVFSASWWASGGSCRTPSSWPSIFFRRSGLGSPRALHALDRDLLLLAGQLQLRLQPRIGGELALDRGTLAAEVLPPAYQGSSSSTSSSLKSELGFDPCGGLRHATIPSTRTSRAALSDAAAHRTSASSPVGGQVQRIRDLLDRKLW